MNTDADQPFNPPPQARFATTHWSMVRAAGDRSLPASDASLESLCRSYWYPLYAFARRRGYSSEDAGDLTQGFFIRLLEKEFLKSADADLGRFRSFLLTVFKRFLSKDRDRRKALKRGGGKLSFSIDFEDGENRYRFEPVDDWTPEKIFHRRWALTLLDDVLAQLEKTYEDKENSALFATCKVYLTQKGPPYAEIAQQLDISQGAARLAVHRLRKRYRELLVAAVADTVDDPESIEDELEYLRNAIRGENF